MILSVIFIPVPVINFGLHAIILFISKRVLLASQAQYPSPSARSTTDEALPDLVPDSSDDDLPELTNFIPGLVEAVD